MSERTEPIKAVRIKGEGPLLLSEFPAVRLPLAEGAPPLVMRVVNIGAASSATIPIAAHYVIVEASVESEVLIPLFYLDRLPGIPSRTFRFALSLTEAVQAGLFPPDRVEVVA